MCGRYLSPDSAAIEREFNLVRAVWRFPEHYNVAPGQDVPAIREAAHGPEGLWVRWGLIPPYARGLPTGYATVNARMETLRTAPSYRHAWTRRQRCLLPATGFYEWQVQADGRSKIPYCIRLADQPVFAFAGLWEVSVKETGEAITSCTVITLPANALLARIHNSRRRMPAILAPQDRQVWLAGSEQDAWRVLQPYPAPCMRAWPVSTRVNSPRNDGPELALPVSA